MSERWRPTASVATLQARARLYAGLRDYFARHGVLEVETPILSAAATVDRHIESFATAEVPGSPQRWLQTSPEFAMKRLLAAGSGPIWQIARVFRRDEAGRHHNPEFSLLEWYRPGFDHRQLMAEVEDLLCQTLGLHGPFPRLSYRDAFLLHAGFDPFQAPLQVLRALPQAAGLAAETDRDFWLDLWMSQVVGPRLGCGVPAFLHDFPPSQAALAQVRDGVALRFELFWDGLELANGFCELTDAGEQARRFRADQDRRRAQGLEVPPHDEQLIAALRSGLPACAGVALGLDRLLMCQLGLPDLASTLAFPADRA
jgi:elongation factor P--(R)-beta-lysine ligase